MDTRYKQEETSRVAQAILDEVVAYPDRATVVGLTGDLGAGKTTLTQELARLLGVTRGVLSPTFVIAKRYEANTHGFRSLVHIDAYRIDTFEELGPLGWDSLVTEPQTLVVVEWPERIESALPKDTQRYEIVHDGEYRVISHV
jgi:tRNA threonylcarbamoyladenosine biosynthesis protein TsaE